MSVGFLKVSVSEDFLDFFLCGLVLSLLLMVPEAAWPSYPRVLECPTHLCPQTLRLRDGGVPRGQGSVPGFPHCGPVALLSPQNHRPFFFAGGGRGGWYAITLLKEKCNEICRKLKEENLDTSPQAQDQVRAKSGLFQDVVRQGGSIFLLFPCKDLHLYQPVSAGGQQPNQSFALGNLNMKNY